MSVLHALLAGIADSAPAVRCHRWVVIFAMMFAAALLLTPRSLTAQDASRSGSGDVTQSPPADIEPIAARAPTLIEMFWASGTVGIIITLLSIVAVGFVVEHFLTIRRQRLIPDSALDQLGAMIGQGRIDEAINYCVQSEHESMVTDVVLAGLERYQGSEFGFADYKSAIEEAGEEYTSKLYRKTEVLSVIAAVAPMLGLLGTVQGMILAFNTIALRGGMARPDELAGAISLALVTTFEGLVVAIPAMVAGSYFRNRIDSLVAEGGKRIERITMPLSRRRL